jgi:hypothetical protein
VRKETRLLSRKEYKCITIRDKVHEEIRRKSKEANLNMKEYIEYVMAKKELL